MVFRLGTTLVLSTPYRIPSRCTFYILLIPCLSIVFRIIVEASEGITVDEGGNSVCSPSVHLGDFFIETLAEWLGRVFCNALVRFAVTLVGPIGSFVIPFQFDHENHLNWASVGRVYYQRFGRDGAKEQVSVTTAVVFEIADSEAVPWYFSHLLVHASHHTVLYMC